MSQRKKSSVIDVDEVFGTNPVQLNNEKCNLNSSATLVNLQMLNGIFTNGFDKDSNKKINRSENKVVSFAESDNIIIPESGFPTLGDSWIHSYNLANDQSLDRSSDYSNSSRGKKYRYCVTKAKLTYKRLPLKLTKYRKGTLHKTYNIGKNTKLDIRMSYPVLGILNRNKNSKVSNVLESSKEKVASKVKLGGNRVFSDVSPYLKMKSSSLFGTSQKETPIEREECSISLDESVDSFRTFVLETSVYNNFNSYSSDRKLPSKVDFGKMTKANSFSGYKDQQKWFRKCQKQEPHTKVINFRNHLGTTKEELETFLLPEIDYDDDETDTSHRTCILKRHKKSIFSDNHEKSSLSKNTFSKFKESLRILNSSLTRDDNFVQMDNSPDLNSVSGEDKSTKMNTHRADRGSTWTSDYAPLSSFLTSNNQQTHSPKPSQIPRLPPRTYCKVRGSPFYSDIARESSVTVNSKDKHISRTYVSCCPSKPTRGILKKPNNTIASQTTSNIPHIVKTKGPKSPLFSHKDSGTKVSDELSIYSSDFYSEKGLDASAVPSVKKSMHPAHPLAFAWQQQPNIFPVSSIANADDKLRNGNIFPNKLSEAYDRLPSKDTIIKEESPISVFAGLQTKTNVQLNKNILEWIPLNPADGIPPEKVVQECDASRRNTSLSKTQSNTICSEKASRSRTSSASIANGAKTNQIHDVKLNNLDRPNSSPKSEKQPNNAMTTFRRNTKSTSAISTPEREGMTLSKNSQPENGSHASALGSQNSKLSVGSGCSRVKRGSLFYTLPLASIPRDLHSQTSTNESDSGLDCDTESQTEERLKAASISSHDNNSRQRVLRGWKQKYEVLLGVVKKPGRLLPESLAAEVRILDAKRQRCVIERALVQSNLDYWESMGGAKGTKALERPESIRALYEQVANLDCLLTSLETQIEVLTSVQDSFPKEFNDTFHDSGTSGHEPDSLEGMETVVDGETKVDRKTKPDFDGGGRGPEEAVVLLHLERCAHRQTRKDLQALKRQYEHLQRQTEDRIQPITRSAGGDSQFLQELNMNSLTSLNSVISDRFVDQLKAMGTATTPDSIKILYPSPYLTQLREMTMSQLRARVLQLEKARLDKVPIDAAKEISRLNASVIHLEKARDELTLQNFTLKSKLAEVTSKINDPAATYQVSKDPSLSIKGPDSDKHERDIHNASRKSTYKVTPDSQKWRQMYSEFESSEVSYRSRIADLETEVKNLQKASSEKLDSHIRHLESQLEKSEEKVEMAERYLLGKEEEYKMVRLDFDAASQENKRLKEQLNETIRKLQERNGLAAKCEDLENVLSRLEVENRLLYEDCNRERVLRKKYYNQIEEMKGKIRVFCRLRPLAELELRLGQETVARAEDAYSILLDTNRGGKNFLFDRVFTPSHGQDEVFEDAYALIKSVLEGYNVTIMAYGQTGSGKTYTMLGTETSPGIAPRAFQQLFELAREGKSWQDVSVSTYILELYNDKLFDLLKGNGHTEHSDKLDIKKDKKGSVYVSGALTKEVSSAEELMKVFEEGVSNRHTTSTRMNTCSSRSHLLITVRLTVTSKQNGSVSKGKLTLVDLAGSERVHKSGATADQLKEANSINKSLSALSDVIAALSTECSFVPYRNSKLTMLLQDSVGGNAKTLVFVNISPAAFNAEETLVSLMYASRIKLITNNVCRNADNKEISRLKSIICKLKKGQEIDEEL